MESDKKSDLHPFENNAALSLLDFGPQLLVSVSYLGVLWLELVQGLAELFFLFLLFRYFLFQSKPLGQYLYNHLGHLLMR